MVFGDGQIIMNCPIKSFSLSASAFSLEVADMIWILGVVARLTKLALLVSGPELGREGVEATKALKAAFGLRLRSSGLRSG